MTNSIATDIRYTLRQMQSAPGLAFAIIATLALTIGANTALFSLLHAVVFRTLSVNDPAGLVLLQAKDARGQSNRHIYHSTFLELARLPIFEAVTLYSGGGVLDTNARGVPAKAGVEAVTPGFHEALGLRPFLGRYFTPADAAGSGSPVAVISHSFWQQHFAADMNVIGERLTIENVPLTVIGVTPPEYTGLYADGGFGVAVPLTILGGLLHAPASQPVRGLNAVARMRTGVSVAEAQAAVDVIWPTLRVETVPPGLSPAAAKDMSTQRMTVESVARGISGLRTQYENPLMVLAAMTSLLLVIGCINLSGLLLGRTAGRAQQLAVCFALGASRRRVVQQLLVETSILSLIGTAVALPVAWWVTRAAGTILWQGTVPLARSLTPDTFVLSMTALVAIATGLILGIMPAWSAIQNRPQTALQTSRAVARGTGRSGKVLLMVQVALCMVLLVEAGLFTGSLQNLRHIDVGVQVEGLQFSRLFRLPGIRPDQIDDTYRQQLVRRVSDLPGVESVALSSAFPAYFNLSDLLPRTAIGRAEDGDGPLAAEGMLERVSPRFFQTVGTPFISGRDFTWRDDKDHPRVAILNEGLARTLFPAGDALGRRVRVGSDPAHASLEVVGIVRNAAMGGVREPHMHVAFVPQLQEPRVAPIIHVRTAGDPSAARTSVTRVIDSMGLEYPYELTTLQDHIDEALMQERLLAGVSSFFAVLAVLLAFVGLHGLLAYGVARRTREIGIRMALGASRRRVVRMILCEGLVLTTVGVAVGIPAAVAAGRLTGSLLFGLAPSDPWTFGLASIFFLAVGATAGVWPALRASSVDPMLALRAD